MMTIPTASNPKVLIGASIPRSGHHFLADMMIGYFGPDLFYCEYYTLSNCCKSVPCTRRGEYRFVFQKNHDRDFLLPDNIKEALYLVQYRHPVPEALSDRALEMQNTMSLPNFDFRSTRAGYAIWLAAKARYYKNFHDKWVARKMPNAIYLDYPELTATPEVLMKSIILRIGADLDERRLADTVARAAAVASGRSIQPFKPHEVADNPHFDAELLGAFEAWVLARCPAYKFSRELTGSYEDSEIYGLILLRDQSEPLPNGETKRFKLAAALGVRIDCALLDGIAWNPGSRRPTAGAFRLSPPSRIFPRSARRRSSA